MTKIHNVERKRMDSAVKTGRWEIVTSLAWLPLHLVYYTNVVHVLTSYVCC